MQGRTLAEQIETLSKYLKYRQKQERLTQQDAKEIRDACGFWSVGIFALSHMRDYVWAGYGKHHEQIMESIERGDRGVMVNVIAPRGSAKTAIMSVIYPLHCIYYKECYELLDMQSDSFILIISQSYQFASHRVRSILRKIEDHRPFHHLIGSSTWGVQLLHTSNGVAVMPQGRGGQVRGGLIGPHRPSLIITDDLEDAESTRNPDQREKNLEWFDTDLMRAGSIDGSTNFINIDTVKHQEAITNKLRNRPSWRSQLHRAIIEPALVYHEEDSDAELLWKEWEGIYTDMTLDNAVRSEKAQSFYDLNQDDMTQGVEELWPEQITYLDVRKEICDTGYHAVMRELQNDCDVGGVSLFDMNKAIRFKITETGLLRSDDRLVKWDEIAGATVFLDWAGGRDTVDNAYACAVCTLWQPMTGTANMQLNERLPTDPDTLAGTNGYVYEVWIDRVGVSDQIKNALNLVEKVKMEVLAKSGADQVYFVVEDFVQDTWHAMKESVERAFTVERANRHHIRDIALQFLPRSRNKIDRITALEPSIKNGWIAFNETLPELFWSQMSQFPTADYLDAPDALEGSTNFRVSVTQEVRRVRRDRYRERVENWHVEV